MNSKRKNTKEETYLVDKILGRRIVNGIEQYKVLWEGYPIDQSTWEPQSNLSTVQYLLDEYNKSLKEKDTKFLKKKRSNDSSQSIKISLNNKEKGKGKGKIKSKQIQQEEEGKETNDAQSEEEKEEEEQENALCEEKEEHLSNDSVRKIDFGVQTEDMMIQPVDATTVNKENKEEDKEKDKENIKEKEKENEESVSKESKENKENKEIKIVRSIDQVKSKHGILKALCTFEEDGEIIHGEIDTYDLKTLAPGLLIDFYQSKLKFIK